MRSPPTILKSSKIKREHLLHMQQHIEGGGGERQKSGNAEHKRLHKMNFKQYLWIQATWLSIEFGYLG